MKKNKFYNYKSAITIAHSPLPIAHSPLPFFQCLVFTSIAVLLLSCSGSRQLSGKNVIDTYHFSPNKILNNARSAVVSAHPLASKVGAKVLADGGNAFDAAIATQFALAVVYPVAGNIGGGGFLVAVKSNGESMTLDYREVAPKAANKTMYLDKNGDVKGNLSTEGHLSGGVPGTVAGIFETYKHARLPFEKLIQPAIDIAQKGFVITAGEALSFNNLQEELKKYNTQRPVFQKEIPWKQGDTLVQKELAETLIRIRDEKADGFYKGKTADLIEAEMKKAGGIISKQDLLEYRAIWRDPYTYVHNGHTIITMPLPSSGGIIVHQMLKMMEKKAELIKGFHSPETVQLMIETERRAFADRSKYMGDPDFYNAPVAEITNDTYLTKRMKDFIPFKAGSSKTTGAGKVKESEETTHISIMDAEGNAVAVTTTLNNSYGSKTVIAGFFLNDEMDDFSIKPGVPNLYGALGGEANAIAPGKRMLSSMTPTIVLKNGKPFLVVGTPGGTTIPTSVFQTLVNILYFNLSTEDAVNQPKFHHQWFPDYVEVEKDISAELVRSLESMGYKVRTRGAIGRTEVIKVLPNGKLEAVADKRGDDSAEGN
jgi:gamma-glutamyltranspeptidase / glutathione hydrolase